jgi:hypothetical protein
VGGKKEKNMRSIHLSELWNLLNYFTLPLTAHKALDTIHLNRFVMCTLTYSAILILFFSFPFLYVASFFYPFFVFLFSIVILPTISIHGPRAQLSI